MNGKRILLIVGGGIAAYKALELVRGLRESGAAVTTILTKGAEQFVAPLSFAALSSAQVHTELFDPLEESRMGHIELSRAADLLVVAPATADLMAKMAGGHADDLASTVLLATDKPVLLAPAMNVRMWLHPATKRNVEAIRADGALFVGPEVGDMACGETGPGRMAEPAAILDGIRLALSSKPLAGKHVIVTSGPTVEPIDPVRFIANRSSGHQGKAIAEALANIGARVTFVTGPASAGMPRGAEVVNVETARQMLDATKSALPADAAVCAAAVVDWRPKTESAGKLKKAEGREAPKLELVENPDILAAVSGAEARPRLVVGFASETEDLEVNARRKLAAKGCDWIVANRVDAELGVFGGPENQVMLISADASEEWPRMGKNEVGLRLAERICAKLAE